jgi:uncharacterized membrane protein YfcA
MWLLAPAVAGATAGGILLLTTPSALFKSLAPYLVLAACGLFAIQPLVSSQVARHLPGKRDGSAGETPAGDTADDDSRARLVVAGAGTFLASIYGGYFGAGLGVVLLALLGLALSDDLVRINGLRAVLSLAVNIAAAVIFAVAAQVDWLYAALLAVSSVVGGYIGARLARRLPPVVFRLVVILLGLVTAGVLLA